MPLKKALSIKKDGHILEEEDMRRKKLSVIAVSLFAAALYGCGSSESGADQTIGEPTAQKGAVSGVKVTLPANGQDVLLSKNDTLAQVTQADPTQAITVIGDDQCINCHQGLNLGGGITPEVVSNYLVGEHVIHSTHITEEEARTSGCYVCHDPITDGPLIEKYVADPATNVPADGLAAITCQVCHGAGGQHYGTGPMPDPIPDANVCGQCHDKQWTDTTTMIPLTPGGTTTESLAAISGSHVNFHPEGYAIYSDYESSAHAGSINSHVILDDNPTSVNTPCARCHTDQGGREYKGIDTVAGLGAVQPVINASPVQCRTCHDPHGPDNQPNSLLMQRTTGSSAEYNTCTNCHQGQNAVPLTAGEVDIPFQGGTVSYSVSATLQQQIIQHADRYNHTITYNHYDDPGTNSTSAELPPPNFEPNIIEGIVIDQAGDVVNQTNASPTSDEQPRSCRPCHNVHSASLTINHEWANSAHSAKIAVFKANADNGENTAANARAVKAAGPTENYPQDPALAAYAAPFVHYDWDDTDGAGINGAGGEESRAACQRCHTATGAKNYLNDPATYDPAHNNFSYLSGWEPLLDENGNVIGNTQSSGQNELLYCWACHTYNNGARRNPGPITADYVDAAGNKVVFPNANDSNICVSCHAGRQDGQNIKNNFNAASNFGSYNSHYLAAAGILYTAIGYEYEGADYANPSFFQHNLVGTTDASGAEVVPGTGTAGPCAGCHMQDDAEGNANHLLTPFAIDPETGQPIDNTPGPVCSVCHGVTTISLTPEVFAGLSDGYDAALTALSDALAEGGIYYSEANYPYFFTSLPVEGEPLPPSYTGWASEQILGAAFNLNLLTRAPGSFVHNDFYAKRLIWDSIYWVRNGSLNTQQTIDLSAYPAAATWFGAINSAAVARP